MGKYIVIVIALAISAACGAKPSADHTAHNSSTNAADHNSMGHGSMDHSAMESSPGADSAPIELQFIDTMIVHHGGAIDMGKLAETRAQDAGLIQLASKIVREQELEIGTMNGLRMKWFGGKDKAVNMNFPGMSEGMTGMDLKKLSGLKGREFDIEFVKQMIPHHEGALVMAKQVRNADSYAELKTFADNIIGSQDAEIKTMRGWLQAWDPK